MLRVKFLAPNPPYQAGECALVSDDFGRRLVEACRARPVSRRALDECEADLDNPPFELDMPPEPVQAVARHYARKRV